MNSKWLMVCAVFLFAVALQVFFMETWIAARPYYVGGTVFLWLVVAVRTTKYPQPVSVEREALVEIVERLGDQTLSGLGRDVRNIALRGLKG